MDVEWEHSFVLLLTGLLVGLGILVKWGLEKTALPALVGYLSLGFLLRTSAFLLRLIGNIINHLGKAIIALYDLAIFPAIWIEEKLKKSPVEAKSEASPKEVHP